MNVIDIVILAILVLSVIWGLYRGFIHTLLSVAACLVSILLALTFGPRLSAVIRGNAGISSTLATYTDAITRVGDHDLAETQVNTLNDDLLSRILDSVSLPDSIENVLRSNLSGKVFASSGLETVNDYVSNTVVGVVINVLCFIACYAAAYLVLSLVISLIQHVFKLPLLKQLDWLAGAGFGLLRGAAIVYVLFLLLPLVSTVLNMDAFSEVLSQSRLAPVFQSDGLFIKIINGIF